MPVIDVRLPPAPDSPGRARHALDPLSDQLPSPVLEDIRLLVSELVTNSVRHAGLGDSGSIGLRVEVRPRLVRVEVSDPGPGFEPGEDTPSIYQDSGWGLYLVGQVADRWGIQRRPGTMVWFEIDRMAAS
jgi:anti-sigma regulatory factor (Ser/Thr protein kinase)